MNVVMLAINRLFVEGQWHGVVSGVSEIDIRAARASSQTVRQYEAACDMTASNVWLHKLVSLQCCLLVRLCSRLHEKWKHLGIVTND